MLLGSNGCGKSTLLRVLGGLLRADAGSVRVDAPCAFVFQNPDHQVVMPTVAADVAFGLGRWVGGMDVLLLGGKDLSGSSRKGHLLWGALVQC